MIQEQYYPREELIKKYSSEPDYITYAEIIPLCRKMFVDELECALSQFGGRFISYKAVSPLEVTCLYPLLHDLEAFYGKNPKSAQKAAQDMIDILKKTETDDDMFPINIIQDIRESVGQEYDPARDLPEWI